MELKFPKHWLPEMDFVPEFMSLKGKRYLQVADRLDWFIGDQRTAEVENAANEAARNCYTITVLKAEVNLEKQAAWFVVRVSDVYGNHADGVGSESAKDFGDYIEKAQTKAVGRALALLGYSTDAAQDFSEGVSQATGETRIVDAPRAPKPIASTEEAATDKQMQFVKQLYPDIDVSGMSKRKASQLIEAKKSA